MTSLSDYLASVEERKRRLGLTDTPQVTEILRNKGARRTEAKRRLLANAAERARCSGLEPVPAYF